MIFPTLVAAAEEGSHLSRQAIADKVLLTTQKRYVFFDLGGTIIDLTSCYLGISQAWGDLAIQASATPADLTRRWNEVGERLHLTRSVEGDRAIFNLSCDAMMEAMRDLGVPGDYGTAVEFTEAASQAIRRWARPFPEASASAFQDVRNLGYSLGIITDADPDLLQALLPRVPSLELFDPIVTSSQIGVTKPHPKIFERAIELSHCSRRESFFVGDTPTDVQGAQASGMLAVVVDRHHSYAGDRKPDLIIHGLDELPRAIARFGQGRST